MTRQRYSKKEGLNRILRLIQGSPTPGDDPGTVTGDLLSEDAAISDIAELLAGSLPNQSGFPLASIFRYGHMYAHNVTGTVVVASADVQYPVSGSFRSGLLNGFTFSNTMHLKPTVAGRYLATYSISIYSASANQEIESALMYNSVFQSGSSAHAEATGANKSHALSGSMILDMAANSILGISVANHTGGNNLIMEHGNLSVLLIAPYGG